jgi:periplasmic protein CpxP/Spy
MKKTLIIAAGVLSVAALGFVLQGCGHGPWGHHSPEKRAEYAVKHIASKLDLTDEQKTKLNAIKDEIVAKFKEERGKHKGTREQAVALWKQDTVNRADVEKLFAEREEHMKTMRPFIIDKLIEFHGMLTPEQRAKAAGIMEEFHKKMQ